MAWYDDAQYGEYYVEELGGGTAEVKDLLFGDDFETDEKAQGLFVEAFFNDDESAYRELVNYLWDEYGLDFEDAFEWADFREWYDAAA